MINRNHIALILFLSTLAGCARVRIYPETTLQGAKASRTELHSQDSRSYLFSLSIPNPDGTRSWSAKSSEQLSLNVKPGKPFTLIEWYATEQRVKTNQPFHLDLFLASAGPESISIQIPVFPNGPQWYGGILSSLL
jgi:hypothetical protein